MGQSTGGIVMANELKVGSAAFKDGLTGDVDQQELAKRARRRSGHTIAEWNELAWQKRDEHMREQMARDATNTDDTAENATDEGEGDEANLGGDMAETNTGVTQSAEEARKNTETHSARLARGPGDTDAAGDGNAAETAGRHKGPKMSMEDRMARVERACGFHN